MVNQKDLRRFAKSFATGVTVVATQTPEGELSGTTTSSVASVSLEPPLYLVCVDQKSNSLLPIVRAGAFSINILQKYQSKIADIFSSRKKSKFSTIKYALGDLGMPRIDEALAVIECKLIKKIQIADHVLLVGLVETSTFNEGEPLIMLSGRFV